MTKEKVIVELESPYNNATVVESFFNTLILFFFFALVIAGLFLLIRVIWTGITFLVEFGLDMFWEWKNSDIKDYSQRRYDAFKKKQYKEWKNEMNKKAMEQDFKEND